MAGRESGVNGGLVGSGRYKLPYDDNDRTALLYQFFLLIEDENFKFGLDQFCLTFYGASGYQEMAAIFNQELVLKFTREVSYRLAENMEDFENAIEIPHEAMMVFHHHDHSVTVHGNVQGSNMASGQASVNQASATNEVA